MITVFVIGNIASGKSTATRYLEQRGARRIDLDQLAKDLYRPGTGVLGPLVQAFGHDILDSDRTVRTSVLAARAFATPETTQKLNDIVHPALLKELGTMLVEPCGCCLAPGAASFTVVEISVASSFTQAFPLADEIIAITAPLDVRRQRAIERGMSPYDFDARAARQPSEEELCALATCVIDNAAGDDTLFAELDRWMLEHGLDPAQGALEFPDA